MVKYKVGNDLKADVLMIFHCLGFLNVSFDCHQGAGIFCNLLKKFGYQVEVVRGFYSSPHLHDGKQIQHSWVEKVLDPYGGKIIIETVPDQVFTELTPEKKVKSLIITQDDEKQERYHPVQESLMNKVLRRSGVCIDKKVITRHSQRVELCIDKTLEKMSIKEKNRT